MGAVQVVGDYGSNCGNENGKGKMNLGPLALIVSKYSVEANEPLWLHKHHFTRLKLNKRFWANRPFSNGGHVESGV